LIAELRIAFSDFRSAWSLQGSAAANLQYIPAKRQSADLWRTRGEP